MNTKSREYWDGFRRGPWGMADPEYWMNDENFAQALAEWKSGQRLGGDDRRNLT